MPQLVCVSLLYKCFIKHMCVPFSSLDFCFNIECKHFCSSSLISLFIWHSGSEFASFPKRLEYGIIAENTNTPELYVTDLPFSKFKY